MNDKIIAENVGHYWKTSRAGVESWQEKIERLVKGAGGKVTGEGIVRQGEQTAVMVAFELGGDDFRLVWPVLHSRSGDKRAAQIQAVTALYHNVKARCVRTKFQGARAAFLDGLLLPDGRTVGEASLPELMSGVPQLLGGLALPAPIDGQWSMEQ